MKDAFKVSPTFVDVIKKVSIRDPLAFLEVRYGSEAVCGSGGYEMKCVEIAVSAVDSDNIKWTDDDLEYGL